MPRAVNISSFPIQAKTIINNRAMPDASAIPSFIARWSDSGAAERANYQLFLSELCDLLDDALLTRLVALKAQRAAEETNGQIRWLRPAFQNKSAIPTQTSIDLSSSAPSTFNLQPAPRPPGRRRSPIKCASSAKP
jgi:hypothetical protein